MASKIFVVLILAFFGLLAEAAPRTPLVFLGSVKNPDAETGAFKETLYYHSLDTVRWHGILENCISYLGVTATPVYIETFQELLDVMGFLDGVRGYNPYFVWLGGDWDQETGKMALIASDNWDPNSETQLTKIATYNEPVYDEDHYYLCKLPV